MSTNLYLGCGPGYPHEQHIQVMGENWEDEWTFIDFYVEAKDVPVKNFKSYNAETLHEYSNETVDKIYSSHFLEHVSHTRVKTVLKNWYRRLKRGGQIILNVPDLEWASREIINYENGKSLSGYFYEFTGEHGLMSVIYGSHSTDGEYHKGGFVKSFLKELLEEVGFKNVVVNQVYEAHAMGCLIAKAEK